MNKKLINISVMLEYLGHLAIIACGKNHVQNMLIIGHLLISLFSHFTR